MTSTEKTSTEARLREIMSKRILVLDGAMGTMIQRYGLTEEDYRGGPEGRFANFAPPASESERELFVKGNNELLSLTQPHIISAIHEEYLKAGADVIETNTFGATSIAQSDYHMAHLVYEMNVQSAKIAREICDKYSTPDHPRFVAGSIGPTPRTASISPDVSDPGARNVTFDQLVEAYLEQIRGLVEGGADLLLVETGFRYLELQSSSFRNRYVLRRVRQKIAHHDFRYCDRRVRTYPVGTDSDGFLVFHPPCPSPDGRAELRSGGCADETLC